MKNKVIGCVTFIGLIVIWILATTFGTIKPIFLPKPMDVIEACVKMFLKENYIHDIAVSVQRVFGGFFAAALFGIPLGLLMSVSEKVCAVFKPLISFIRYMPASAFIPMFIIWFGLGETEKMAVIFYGSFFYLTLMIMDVAKNVDETLIEVSYTLGARKRQVFLKVILRASLPGIMDALRTTFGAAWTYLIVAEIVGASSGLGYAIQSASRFLKTEKMFVGIITIGILGLISDKLFALIYKKSFGYLNKGGV